jgi:hypothetical protein
MISPQNKEQPQYQDVKNYDTIQTSKSFPLSLNTNRNHIQTPKHNLKAEIMNECLTFCKNKINSLATARSHTS